MPKIINQINGLLSTKNISVADLFKSIKKQTGLMLFYSNAVLDDSKRMKFSSGKVRLDDLLTEILSQKHCMNI